MAYDDYLANCIRRALAERRDFTERKMFGGLAFLYQGRMCCGVGCHGVQSRWYVEREP